MGLGEKKQAVMQYNSQGLPLRIALPLAELSKSQYYYRVKKGRPGIKRSSITKLETKTGTVMLSNNLVVKRIEKIQKDPDLSYGYRAMTNALQQEGYNINHKKVYRLMKENHLLHKPNKRANNKTYVKYRKVQPTRPLEVLEMDLKMVWIERERKHAFVLNIIDTFSRKWLYQYSGFSIKQQQVKHAWEYLIEHYLQPADLLKKKLHMEIRNDNDKRFSAQMIQDFFKQNHLNQVFTHPYTPQENGHIESFHAILSRHLKLNSFWSLQQLEQNLILFNEKYNNQRLHGSIAHLCPNDFEELFRKDLIQISSNIKQRKIVFKLKIPRHQIKQLSGNIEPKGSSSHDFEPLDGAIKSIIETNGAKISNNLRYKKSPSVAPRLAKISTKNRIIGKLKC